MSTLSARPPPLDIGRVLREAFALLERNFGVYVTLALILAGLPTVAISAARMAVGPHAGVTLVDVGLYLAQSGAITLLAATLTQAAVADAGGRRPGVARSLRAAAALLPGFAGVYAVYLVGFLGGLVLLLVPGIVVAVIWRVAMPVYVVERSGVIQAFRRSAQLTAGHRWRILGLSLAVLAILLVYWSLFVGMAVLARPGGLTAAWVFAVGVNPIYYAGTGLVSGAVGTALYLELRRLHDGVAAQGLAEVFD